MSAGDMEAGRERVIATLRAHDSDRFLAGLFAPPEARGSLFAVLALDHELARIPHTVSETMLGAIRFQWWRETVEAMAQGTEPAHELGPQLADAMRRGGLTADDIIALIDAHEEMLEPFPFATLAEMTAHARGTAGQVMRLGARVLGGDPDHAALAPAGEAFGLVQLLRGMAAQAARHCLVLPRDVLDVEGAMLDDVFSGRMSAQLRAAVGTVLQHIETAHASAHDAASPLPRELAPVLLPAGLAPLYVKRMKRPGFDPFRKPGDVPAFRRQITLLSRVTRKTL